MKRHRSVLNRLERVKILHERGRLGLEEFSVLGLPKVKHLKIRIKKEKAAAPAAGTEPAAAASTEGAAAGAGAKPGAAPSPKAPAAPKGQAAPSKGTAPPKKKE